MAKITITRHDGNTNVRQAIDGKDLDAYIDAGWVEVAKHHGGLESMGGDDNQPVEINLEGVVATVPAQPKKPRRPRKAK